MSTTIARALGLKVPRERFEPLRLGTLLNGATMLDFLLLALAIGFFAISIAYAFGCDHL